MKEPIRHITATTARGSALILTVVLTSLLAVVGVLFVMTARIDRMGTTAATESRELTGALDTVLAMIDRTLVENVPGVTAEARYYDYPDEHNPWLTDLKPYEVARGNNREYYWRQISNLDGLLTSGTRDVRIGVVGERTAFDNPNNAVDPNVLADASGDGVGDAKWFQIPGLTSSRGRPLYAAVRIIDNGAMLNLNTGFRFDPDDSEKSRVDGRSQLQINVAALTARPDARVEETKAEALLSARTNNLTDPARTRDLARYERDVIWQYLDVRNPSPYTPFDMSDELELRYRYLLNHKPTTARIENAGRFITEYTLSVPLRYGSGSLDGWFRKVVFDPCDPGSYLYRHIATTYNMDRIITPRPLELDDGTTRRKKVNVNAPDMRTLRVAVTAALREMDPDAYDIPERAAQITANLLDYIDDDDEVTVIADMSSVYYGFERPCIYISELACRRVQDATGAVRSSYAIELYKPYFEHRDPQSGRWRLRIDRPLNPIFIPLEWTGSRRFHVVLAEDPAASLAANYLAFTDPEEPADTMPRFGYNRNDYRNRPQTMSPDGFEPGTMIELQRSVPEGSQWLTVDFVRVPDRVPGGWMEIDGVARSIQRDISSHRCIRRLWSPVAQSATPGLGNAIGNYVYAGDTETIQANPAGRPLINIGELGMIFATSAYGVREGAVADEVLIDLQSPAFSRLFNYLTVMDPSRFGHPEHETRVMGRININTAPPFVIAQLPWLSYVEPPDEDSPANRMQRAMYRAEAIVEYRNRNGAYQSIGDLMRVPALHRLKYDGAANQFTGPRPGPDLTPDNAMDDHEERDLLFTRISDLVTVRSDVFTAYILVRIGEDGPQRRIIALLDRSQVNSRNDRVRILARHLVADPR